MLVCVCVCLLSIFRFSFIAAPFPVSSFFARVLSFGTFIIFIAISYSIWPSVSCLSFGLCLLLSLTFPIFFPHFTPPLFGQNVSSPLLIFSVGRMFAFALLAMAEMQYRLDAAFVQREACRGARPTARTNRLMFLFVLAELFWFAIWLQSVLFWPIRHDCFRFDLFYIFFLFAICWVNKI